MTMSRSNDVSYTTQSAPCRRIEPICAKVSGLSERLAIPPQPPGHATRTADTTGSRTNGCASHRRRCDGSQSNANTAAACNWALVATSPTDPRRTISRRHEHGVSHRNRVVATSLTPQRGGVVRFPCSAQKNRLPGSPHPRGSLALSGEKPATEPTCEARIGRVKYCAPPKYHVGRAREDTRQFDGGGSVPVFAVVSHRSAMLDVVGAWPAGEVLGLDFETTGIDRFNDVPVSYALVSVVEGVVVGAGPESSTLAVRSRRRRPRYTASRRSRPATRMPLRDAMALVSDAVVAARSAVRRWSV